MRQGPLLGVYRHGTLFVGMESICYTNLELGMITHDSSIHRTHVAHRKVLLGVGSAPLKIVRAQRFLLVVYRHGTLIYRDGKHLLYHFGVGNDYS